MKAIRIFFGILLITLFACDNTEGITEEDTFCETDSLFTICKDTFQVKIEGRMQKSLYYNENYYVFYLSQNTENFYRTNHLYEISNAGETIREMRIPHKMEEWIYFDFFEQNDSFYAVNQYNKCYVLGDLEKGNWQESNPVNNILFENSDFEVFGTCSGEFGGSILFKDKKRDSIYSALSICPIVVNERKGSYYITNFMGHMEGFASVLKIENPRKITARHKDSILNTSFGETFSTKGTESLMDTMGFHIATSFIRNGNLVHYYSTDSGSFIGELENEAMHQVYQFQNTIYPGYQHTLEDGTQLLNFYSPQDSLNGFMEIKNSTIKLHYIMSK